VDRIKKNHIILNIVTGKEIATDRKKCKCCSKGLKIWSILSNNKKNKNSIVSLQTLKLDMVKIKKLTISKIKYHIGMKNFTGNKTNLTITAILA